MDSSTTIARCSGCSKPFSFDTVERLAIECMGKEGKLIVLPRDIGEIKCPYCKEFLYGVVEDDLADDEAELLENLGESAAKHILAEADVVEGGSLHEKFGHLPMFSCKKCGWWRTVSESLKAGAIGVCPKCQSLIDPLESTIDKIMEAEAERAHKEIKKLYPSSPFASLQLGPLHELPVLGSVPTLPAFPLSGHHGGPREIRAGIDCMLCGATLIEHEKAKRCPRCYPVGL